MEYQKALQEAGRRLTEASIEEPQADAWCLFEFCTGMDRTHYFLEQKEEMPQEQYRKFMELISEREKRIPVQHLTGVQYFCGLEFEVNSHVLIPRQDTECLVEEAVRKLKNGDRVLDLCTGSGCIIISIEKLSRKQLTCFASDISVDALSVAKKNVEKLDARVTLVHSDLFERITEQFDCIVSNPPYIATAEIEKLTPEVKGHDPYLALDGKEDGLFFYKRIIREAEGYLRPEGWLMFEIGYDQGYSVSELMGKAGFDKIQVKKDLAGLDRVVIGQRK